MAFFMPSESQYDNFALYWYGFIFICIAIIFYVLNVKNISDARKIKVCIFFIGLYCLMLAFIISYNPYPKIITSITNSDLTWEEMDQYAHSKDKNVRFSVLSNIGVSLPVIEFLTKDPSYTIQNKANELLFSGGGTIRKQFLALRNGNYELAYSYTTDNFRSNTSLEAFKSFFETTINFQDVTNMGITATQRDTAKTEKITTIFERKDEKFKYKNPIIIEYSIIKKDNGPWLIEAINLIQI